MIGGLYQWFLDWGGVVFGISYAVALLVVSVWMMGVATGAIEPPPLPGDKNHKR